MEAHIKGAEEDFKEEVAVEVCETMLEPKEADAAFEELIDVLSERIWGQNASSQEISLDLELPEYIEGYPFCLVWESSNDKVLDSDGILIKEKNSKLKTFKLSSNKITNSTASLTYEDGRVEKLRNIKGVVVEGDFLLIKTKTNSYIIQRCND